MVRHLLTGQTERGADLVLRIVFAPFQGDRGDIMRANFRTQVSDRLAGRQRSSRSRNAFPNTPCGSSRSRVPTASCHTAAP